MGKTIKKKKKILLLVNYNKRYQLMKNISRCF